MLLLTAASIAIFAPANAKKHTDALRTPNLTDALGYTIEWQGSASDGQTPLWLNANRYGLSSLKSTNTYLRAAIERPLAADSARRWGIGYGADVAVAARYTSTFIVQQAYAEGRWLHGTLTIGSKQQPMELKNNRLSSGSQTLGINARPVPQVRLALPQYVCANLGRRWMLGVKGHLAYGMLTDDGWQHEFTNRKSKYVDHTLYHSKAGYLLIGRKGAPLSVEMGLEMATLFGGDTYKPNSEGVMQHIENQKGLSAFWRALVPGGGDKPEQGTAYTNVTGDMLGSWVMRINYDAPTWAAHIYADHFFEDHSQMFFLDYDGYGTGDDWNKRTKQRYFLYDLKDMMLGAEINLKRGRWVRNIVMEYLYTKYQSGPVYHDRTQNIADHVAGIDEYYNHYIYAGWQHWGQTMGNPLYRSPIYNTDGTIQTENSRFVAMHFGLDGQPSRCLDYRFLATWQQGFGTYNLPYTHPRHDFSLMLEATCHLRRGWNITGAAGADFGSILGRNTGVQITVSKHTLVKRHK